MGERGIPAADAEQGAPARLPCTVLMADAVTAALRVKGLVTDVASRS